MVILRCNVVSLHKIRDVRTNQNPIKFRIIGFIQCLEVKVSRIEHVKLLTCSVRKCVLRFQMLVHQICDVPSKSYKNHPVK